MTETSIDDDQLNEVLSKLHDERLCVTGKSLCIDFGITRREAHRLLEAVLSTSPKGFPSEEEEEYEVTRYVMKKNVNGVRVATLQKSKTSIRPSPSTPPPPSIYSIALIDPKTKTAAPPNGGHAYTMTLLRDALLLPGGPPATPLDPTMACDAISPAGGGGVEMLDVGEARENRIRSLGGGAVVKERTSAVMRGNVSKPERNVGSSSGKSVNTKKVKSISAASFFGSSNGNRTNTNRKNAIATKDEKKTNATKKKPPFPPTTKSKSKKRTGGIANKVSKEEEEDEGTEDAPPEETTEPEPEPETTTDKGEKRTIGTADDFVGDEDEDEEFLLEDEERKERNAREEEKRREERAVREERRRGRKRRVLEDSDEEGGGGGDVEMEEDGKDGGEEEGGEVEYDDGEEITKAKKKKEMESIDRFASKRKEVEKDASTEGNGSKKRRKQVLEEQTFMDNKGFFQTKMVRVWKEISDDDDDDDDDGCEKENDSTSATAGKMKTTAPASGSSAGIGKGTNPKGKGGKSTTATKASTTTKSQKPKVKKNMKQQGLMGFFSVKK